ncbi:polysaccharide pyruvyl transferase family protein [Fodinibacter luteus]|uniref:Polysaccharide pyruvyl transferase family protein n=1 Tax=Fodinibacter luteus TaxID=552064 RepID=A0ABP8JWB7_9MICO
MAVAPTQPLRVGLYGFFGMGNLGNEGSLAAVVAHLRAAHPDVQVVCFGADAAQVEREHGVPGRQLMAFRARPGDRRLVTRARKVLGRLWDVPRTVRMVGQVDVLVVPGTGVLESRLMSTPWGLPYWMAIAFTACHLRGRPSALVSVGAEPATRAATRLLMRQAVRSATHVTYRDTASAQAARGMGAAGRPGTVAPDVAFALPDPVGVAVRPGHVVVGVMSYSGAADDPGRGPEVAEAYRARMTEVVTRLLDGGHTVTFLVGDRADLGLAETLEHRVREARPLLGDSLTTSHARDLAGLMTEMAAAEVVVATRFHNIICALKARRPVVSLGYAGKNADLLERFGLEGFDQPVDAFDVERVLADVDRLLATQDAVTRVIAAALVDVERDVAAHLTAVSSALLGSDEGVRPSPSRSLA